jgi:hypothetical protein
MNQKFSKVRYILFISILRTVIIALILTIGTHIVKKIFYPKLPEDNYPKKELSLTDSKGKKLDLTPFAKEEFDDNPKNEKLTDFGLTDSEVDALLIKVINEVNKSMPIMKDSETRCEGIVPQPGRILLYRFTLINKLKKEIDLESFNNLLVSGKPVVINQINSASQMDQLRNARVTFIYDYIDKIGNHIASLTIKPDEYQKSVSQNLIDNNQTDIQTRRIHGKYSFKDAEFKEFFYSLKNSPYIKGLPEGYEEFKFHLSKEEKLQKFYLSLKANTNIIGIPDSYNDFLIKYIE